MKKSIDYISEAEKFRPKVIRTLLIAEAPPPSGRKYFYVPRDVSTKRPIANDRNLSATIFNHYFRKRPSTKEGYEKLLRKLQERGIFLIDILDKPLRIRGNKKNKRILIKQIPKLRKKIKSRKIKIEDKKIIFLLPRKSYKSYIKRHFPNSKIISWANFRRTKNKY